MRIGLLATALCALGSTTLGGTILGGTILGGTMGCASGTPPAKSPEYFRSPSRDYVQPPRSASDGDVLGAHQHPPDDWMLAAPTADHPAIGWETRYGRLQFEPELTRAGHGVAVEPRVCAPPHTPPRPEDELEERAALYRAWLREKRSRDALAPSDAVIEVAQLQSSSSILDCD